jgi:methylmalonyl-CoA mutase
MILEAIHATDAQEANALALEALNAGAESIWFHKSFLGAAAEVATKGIDQRIAPVFIRGNNIKAPYKCLLKEGAEPAFSSEKMLLDGSVFRERGATPIQEAALLLSQGVECLDNGALVDQLYFRSGYGSAFLTEIAKTRALRWLWASLLQQKHIASDGMQLIGLNLTHHYPINDEHTNILRASSAAMAAVIGGADFVMLRPWNAHWKADDRFSQRITRNIHNLMKEEGKLDKNLNPADGSYFIEHLTLRMAQEIWNTTQIILREGGFAAYAKSGKLKNDLSSSRAVLIQSYRDEKRILLGVNKYPPSEVKAEQKPSASTYDLLPDYCHLPTEIAQ